MYHVRRPPLVLLLSGALAASAMAGDIPDPKPPAVPQPRPVSQSVDKVVEEMEARRKDPCLAAREQGRPCFPATTSIPGPTASVREGLGILGPKDAWSPKRPPTQEEMGPYRPGPPRSLIPNMASVTFDPVCAAKGLVKALKGKNQTFYLYRIKDPHGERVALYDHKVDASRFQGEAEFLGKFTGECEALAELRRAERKLRPTPPAPEP